MQQELQFGRAAFSYGTGIAVRICVLALHSTQSRPFFRIRLLAFACSVQVANKLFYEDLHNMILQFHLVCACSGCSDVAAAQGTDSKCWDLQLWTEHSMNKDSINCNCCCRCVLFVGSADVL